MNQKVICTGVAALLTAGCMPSLARNSSEPTPALTAVVGDRVRVLHRSPCCATPLIGFEDSLTNDALWVKIDRDKSRVAVPVASITRVDKWVHVPPPPAGKLYAVGVLGGAGFGLLLDVFMGRLSRKPTWGYQPGRMMAGGAALGFIGATMVGALEDAKWEAAALSPAR